MRKISDSKRKKVYLYISGGASLFFLILQYITSGPFLIFFLFSLAFLFDSLFISYKEYNINGKKVSVYSGLYSHTLKVNEEKCDEYKSLTRVNTIILSTTLEDDTYIQATISLSNKIALKVNDKLVLSEKEKAKEVN